MCSFYKALYIELHKRGNDHYYLFKRIQMDIPHLICISGSTKKSTGYNGKNDKVIEKYETYPQEPSIWIK